MRFAVLSVSYILSLLAIDPSEDLNNHFTLTMGQTMELTELHDVEVHLIDLQRCADQAADKIDGKIQIWHPACDFCNGGRDGRLVLSGGVGFVQRGHVL